MVRLVAVAIIASLIQNFEVAGFVASEVHEVDRFKVADFAVEENGAGIQNRPLLASSSEHPRGSPIMTHARESAEARGSWRDEQTAVGEANGLLQATSPRVKSRVMATAMLQTKSGSTAKVLGAMKDVVAQIEAAKEAGTWDGTDAEEFVGLMQELRDAYVAVLDSDHSQDSALWTTELAKHNACHTLSQKRFGQGGDVPNHESDVQKHRRKHELCRKAGKSWDIYKEQFVECEQSTSVGDFLTKATSHDALYSKLTRLNADVTTYEEEQPVTDSLPASCDADQIEFESAVCATREATLFACEAEQDCINVVDLQTTKQSLSTRTTNRRALKLALLKVMCKFKEVLDKYKDVDGSKAWTHTSNGQVSTACNNETLGATEYIFDMTMPMPESSHCRAPSVSSYPSRTSTPSCNQWRQEEFSIWQPDTYNIPSSCLTTSCAETPERPNPVAPSDDCVDNDDDASLCPFYKYHHDACGKFEDNANVKCCDCGGGEGPPTDDCSCRVQVYNYLHAVFVDGTEVPRSTSSSTSPEQPGTYLFKCAKNSVFAFVGSVKYGPEGCSTGGATVACTSTDISSPWHGLTHGSGGWKVWNDITCSPWNSCDATCGTGTCASRSEKTFDDSAWATASSSSKRGDAAGPGLCGSGTGWLFRHSF